MRKTDEKFYPIVRQCNEFALYKILGNKTILLQTFGNFVELVHNIIPPLSKPDEYELYDELFIKAFYALKLTEEEMIKRVGKEKLTEHFKYKELYTISRTHKYNFISPYIEYEKGLPHFAGFKSIVDIELLRGTKVA